MRGGECGGVVCERGGGSVGEERGGDFRARSYRLLCVCNMSRFSNATTLGG